MIEVIPPLLTEKALFPKEKGFKFNVWMSNAANWKQGDLVRLRLVLAGIGEIEERCTFEQFVNRDFWGSKHPEAYGYLQQSVPWPIVFVFVQTTEKSRYMNGEIPYALELAAERYNIVETSFEGISLGGYGALDYFNSPERLKPFKKAVFNMPGGNGGAGKLFPAAAKAAGVECLFLHAADDTVALPKQSIEMDRQIKELGGKSTLVLYQKGGHGIITRSWGVWGNIKIKGSYNSGILWNTTTFAITPQSDRPDWVVPDWLCKNPVEEPKLIYSQQIWQRADGSCFSKELKDPIKIL